MKRVLLAEFMHESNTFSIQTTDEDAFRACQLQRAGEVAAVYRGTRSAMGAGFEAAEEFGWRLVHPVVAHANPSGRVADAFFDRIAGEIVAAADGVDGVLRLRHLEWEHCMVVHDSMTRSYKAVVCSPTSSL